MSVAHEEICIWTHKWFCQSLVAKGDNSSYLGADKEDPKFKDSSLPVSSSLV